MCLLVARSDVNTAGSAAPEGCMGRMEMMMMMMMMLALQCNATQRHEASFAHALCKTLYMWCVFCLCIQEEATQVKRSSSPPRGAPKKRTAFIDITNVSTFFLSFLKVVTWALTAGSELQ